MKILVTGGAGFIGSHLCERLVHEGHQVVALDNFDPYYDPAIKQRNLDRLLQVKHFTLVKGDIRDSKLIHQVFEQEKVELIYHLAAKAGVRPSISDPSGYMDVNVMGTINILEAMKQHGVTKMIFASSSSVYGNNKKTPFSENDNVDYPVSPYAASKKTGELICHTYHSLYKFDIFCLRFFTVYGPRQRPEMAISLFMDSILKGKTIRMFGDGTSRRDYTYIDDILEGLLASKTRLGGFEIINLGNSHTITLSDLVSSIEKVTGKKALIEKLPMQAGDVDKTFADISKANKLLSYHPGTKIVEGLKKYYDWMIHR